MALFKIGQAMQTRSINEACKRSADFTIEIREAFKKYASGNWGDTSEADKQLNDSAVKNNDTRIVAKYKTSQGNIFIITEQDREQTIIMFANEY